MGCIEREGVIMISSQLRPLNLLDDRPTDLKEFVALRAVVVAQLVECSLPTQEVRGSNRVIGKLLNQMGGSPGLVVMGGD